MFPLKKSVFKTQTKPYLFIYLFSMGQGRHTHAAKPTVSRPWPIGKKHIQTSRYKQLLNHLKWYRNPSMLFFCDFKFHFCQWAKAGAYRQAKRALALAHWKKTSKCQNHWECKRFWNHLKRYQNHFVLFFLRKSVPVLPPIYQGNVDRVLVHPRAKLNSKI